jgi:hypothetical protein
MAFPSNRFAYQLISDKDRERAIETVNHYTTQGWRARHMCVDPNDGSVLILLELKFDLRGKQRLSKGLAEREVRPAAKR